MAKNGRGATPLLELAAYDYRASDGTLLYQALRYFPKDFRQRRPDGAGGWKWDMKPLKGKHVPYRLPELAGHHTVLIVEGEKDVDRLWSVGIAATTNIGGAGKWGQSETQHLKLAGVQQVRVIPDNDKPGMKHARQVVASLTAVGMAVRVIELPGLDAHGDVSDWLDGGHTKEELVALLGSTLEVPPAGVAQPVDEPLVLDPADPLPSARLFVGRRHTVAGIRALCHQAGVFFFHDGTASAYRELEEAAVRAGLYQFLEAAQTAAGGPFKPTRSKVENVLDALRAHCNLPAACAAPCWLLDDPGLDPLDVVPCCNGLLHTPTREVLPLTPTFFSLNGLDFAYDPAAPPPAAWLAFLQSLWPTDADSIATLQEIFGYLLTPRTHFQKIFMMVGPKRSGKGTVGRVIRRLLGARNVAGPTLANMAAPFGRATLIGKSLAIIADARISGRTDTAAVTEQLLSISGEDHGSTPRKFLPDWDGTLSARFLMLTNELPKIEDASGALASRFIVLTLEQSFFGQEDHGLFDRLLPELGGILNWALDGADRLRTRGRFLQPVGAANLIRQFEDLGSPIQAFLRDTCDVGSGFDVVQARLFDTWKAWCRDNGRDRPGTRQTFGRDVRAAVPGLQETRPHVAGARVRFYDGLRLKVSNSE